MLNDISSFGIPVIMVGTIIGVVWYANTWLNKQFSHTKTVIFEKLEKVQDVILNKMEYHERHDDQRFFAVQNDIWAIKVRNAAIDGQTGAAKERN